MTELLINGLNGVLARRGVAGCAYGRASIFKTFIGAETPRITQGDFSRVQEDTRRLLQGPPCTTELRQGMLLNGVDLMRVAGFVSAAHSSDIIEETVQAFDRTIARLQQEAILS
jgi:glutamate-1-semialdehyde aminotransferase